jgi:hypothetical protein
MEAKMLHKCQLQCQDQMTKVGTICIGTYIRGLSLAVTMYVHMFVGSFKGRRFLFESISIYESLPISPPSRKTSKNTISADFCHSIEKLTS